MEESTMAPKQSLRGTGTMPLVRSLEPPAAGALAGLVAGVVYLAGRMLAAELLTPHGPLAPFARIAALLMGPDVLPPTDATFGVVTMALMIHGVLCVFCGQIIGRVVDALDLNAIDVGLCVGLGLFILNYFVLAPLLFPWFSGGAHVGTAISHMLFGAVAAGAYALLRVPRTRD
jgi:hypothetical protein